MSTPERKCIGGPEQKSITMSEVARPISLRLAPRHVEALKARAHTVSGTLTGVARELILAGLAGGDNRVLAERLMQIERRFAALEGLARDVRVRPPHRHRNGGVARQVRCSAERAVLWRGGAMIQHTKALFLGALFVGMAALTAFKRNHHRPLSSRRDRDFCFSA
jgi:hypothetical protein